MAHSLQEYTNLIRRLEVENRDHPFRYKIKLFILAVLGMGYILFMLVLALLLSVGLLAGAIFSKNIWIIKAMLKVILVPLALSFFIFKAMWVRFTPPEGHYLKAKDAPDLFKLVEEVRKSLNAKSIHNIVITPELNAAVMQVPRLGMLGWPKRYLILGLPLINMLSVEELRAVIGHEFGHLTKNHMRFSNWIYRIRSLWYVLLDKLEQQASSTSWVFTRFFNWYAPYFNAYSFVLARSSEYEADREAALITTPQIAGSALTKTYAFADYLDGSYWKSVFDNVKQQSFAPTNVFTGQISGIHQTTAQTLQQYIDGAIREETGISDTHPCLSDRLKGLDVKAEIQSLGESNSAAVLLGETNQVLLEQFDHNWKEHIQEEWSWRHEQLETCREKIETCREKELESLSEEELWEFAMATDQYDSTSAAMPLYKALLVRNEQHARANYVVGEYLLFNHDEAGVPHIKTAIEVDPELAGEGNQLLYEFFIYVKNDEQAAQPFLEKIQSYNREYVQADAERESLSPKSKFMPHGLDEKQLENVLAAVKAVSGIKKVWLVRREVQHLPNIPAYFILFQMKGMVFSQNKLSQTVADTVAAVLPNGSVHVANAAENRRLKRKINKISDARII